MKKFESVEEYINSFPPQPQAKLKEMRALIKELAPEATEKISYGMPYYSFKGRLIYFAAFRNHYSLFPASRSAFEAFKDDLKAYETSKGTVRFSLDKPLPKDLIRKIVEFRVRENLRKTN